MLGPTHDTQRRPSPAVVRAKRHEIAVRYSRHGRLPKAIVRNRVRFADLRRVFRDHYGRFVLPDDDAGRDDAQIAIDHLVGTPGITQRKINAWLNQWAPWMTPGEIEDCLAQAYRWPWKWTAEKLGTHLNLTDADRTRLRITTIAPCDLTKSERAKRRADRKRERDRNRQRQKRQAERWQRTLDLSQRTERVRSTLSDKWQLASEIADACAPDFNGLCGRSLRRAINRALNKLVQARMAEQRPAPRQAQYFRRVWSPEDPENGMCFE